jgi:hypothetical protein
MSGFLGGSSCDKRCDEWIWIVIIIVVLILLFNFD